MNSIYDISINDLENKSLDWEQFKGKHLLIVNVASECGYTPQYQQLQELYEAYDGHLEIIGVPCNDFGAQEPGNASEIVKFCELNYGVTFPLTEKVGILKNAHPLYKWLQSKKLNGKEDYKVEWNFHKFLLDNEGQIIDSFPSAVSPFDEDILKHI